MEAQESVNFFKMMPVERPQYPPVPHAFSPSYEGQTRVMHLEAIEHARTCDLAECVAVLTSQVNSTSPERIMLARE
jgi:hypothetical protein